MFGLFRMRPQDAALSDHEERRRNIEALQALLEEIRSPYPTRSELAVVVTDAVDGELTAASVQVINRLLGTQPLRDFAQAA